MYWGPEVQDGEEEANKCIKELLASLFGCVFLFLLFRKHLVVAPRRVVKEYKKNVSGAGTVLAHTSLSLAEPEFEHKE